MSTWKSTIPPFLANDREGEFIALLAVRGALGGESRYTDDCVNWLRRVWPMLHKAAQSRIKKEIKEAINQGKSGSYWDTMYWQKLIGED